MNHDQYPTEANKISYGMSHLNKDTVQTIDLFFYNSTFANFKTLISLLEQIYNNASREYIAITKLKTL